MALSRKAEGDGQIFNGEEQVFTGKDKDGKEVVFTLDFDDIDILKSEDLLKKEAEFEAKIKEEYQIKTEE